MRRAVLMMALIIAGMKLAAGDPTRNGDFANSGANRDSGGTSSSIKAAREVGEYKGDIGFPHTWTVFIPVGKDFVPSAEQLRGIPDSLDGAGPRVIGLRSSETGRGHEIDFAPLFGETKIGNCAWAFAELNSAFDRECTFGAGADWWMQYFVNGEKVIDTLEFGNGRSPLRMDDHLADVKLKKGRNILAVKFVSGISSAVLMLGGPNDLRLLPDRLHVTQIMNLDDYDSDAGRPGNPARINGPAAPEISTLTGQGVYTAAPEVNICFPGETFMLPPDYGGYYFITGIRLQSFGSRSRADSSCSIYIAMTGGGAKLSFQIDHKKDSGMLSASVREPTGGRTSVRAQALIPYAALPIDIMLAVNQKHYAVNTTSLADGSFHSFGGELPVPGGGGNTSFETGVTFKSADRSPAEMIVDNYFAGRGWQTGARLP